MFLIIYQFFNTKYVIILLLVFKYNSPRKFKVERANLKITAFFRTLFNLLKKSLIFNIIEQIFQNRSCFVISLQMQLHIKYNNSFNLKITENFIIKFN